MKARDLMAPYPGVVTAGDPLSRAAGIMRDWDVGMVPVVDDTLAMHLLGVITDRDIAVRCVAPRHGGRCSVGAHRRLDRWRRWSPTRRCVRRWSG